MDPVLGSDAADFLTPAGAGPIYVTGILLEQYVGGATSVMDPSYDETGVLEQHD